MAISINKVYQRFVDRIYFFGCIICNNLSIIKRKENHIILHSFCFFLQNILLQLWGMFKLNRELSILPSIIVRYSKDTQITEPNRFVFPAQLKHPYRLTQSSAISFFPQRSREEF